MMIVWLVHTCFLVTIPKTLTTPTLFSDLFITLTKNVFPKKNYPLKMEKNWKKSTSSSSTKKYQKEKRFTHSSNQEFKQKI